MRAFAAESWTRATEIIIGIDIGTTQSAVSFAYLYPDGPQSVTRVSNWPGQGAHKGESKIPTLIYYNRNNEAVSFGAEVLKPTVVTQAEEEGWQLARYFKLHLHPKSMTKHHQVQADPLPQGIPVAKIYQDFMGYLMNHTRRFFESHVVGGEKVWADHHENKIVVIAHPNGWTLNEQAVLREAAVRANYVSKSKALTHIRFVSEGEASVHFCMFHSNLHNELEPGMDFLVCDAGGSTIDITSYRVKTTEPMLELEEQKASACVQAGAVFVDLECRKHIASLLSKLDLEQDEYDDYLRDGVADFENADKKDFESTDLDYHVSLGCRLTRPEIRLRRGTVTVSGQIVRSFFDRCVEETVSAIRQQMLGLTPKHILLAGGFGDSPYLRLVLSSEFNRSGCTVTICNDSTSKAVADGVVIWWAKMSIVSRATRMQFGKGAARLYDFQSTNHIGRAPKRFLDGKDYVKGTWSQIVDKDVIMDADLKIYTNYVWRWQSVPETITVAMPIYAWTRNDEPPGYWLFDTDMILVEGFERIGEVEVTLAGEQKDALKQLISSEGVYYQWNYRVAVKFGGTEVLASVEWEKNGKTQTSLATILPSALKSL